MKREHVEVLIEKTQARIANDEAEKSTFQPEPDPRDETPLIPSIRHPLEIELSFNGTAKDYFRVWIVNLCLSLLTLGIFTAWAKVRKKRYLYSHTTLGGTPFQYLGQPIPILKGRIIAAIGFAIYYTSTHFISALLPFVLVAGLIAAPWVLIRSAAFNSRYSAFRNMTFKFNGTYTGGLKTLYVWGFIPAIAVGLILANKGHHVVLIVASITFTIFFPWWTCRLKGYIVENTFFGGKRGRFSAKWTEFFLVYFFSGLIVLGISIPMVMAFSFFMARAQNAMIFSYVGLLMVYSGYVVAYAYMKARIGNYVWNNIKLGPIHFKSTLRIRDLLFLYVTNALGIIISLGLLIPWAVVRTLKYRADHLQVFHTDTLYQLQGSDKSAVDAVGAETIDLFDMDLSL